MLGVQIEKVELQTLTCHNFDTLEVQGHTVPHWKALSGCA